VSLARGLEYRLLFDTVLLPYTNKAEELIGKQEYSKARKKLEKVLAKVDKNSYEQVITLRSLASVYALENNYKQAARLLEQALATKKHQLNASNASTLLK
jgi:predicted negative regulator of RcsB-dependent stress response